MKNVVDASGESDSNVDHSVAKEANDLRASEDAKAATSLAAIYTALANAFDSP